MYDDYIVPVAGDPSRAAFLIKGEKQNILHDACMAYSAPKMIDNIRRELGDKPLDAVILSHSHYDHIMGFPYLKREWPELKVYSSEYAKKIIEKPSARQLMRELSMAAASDAGLPLPDYSDDELVIDETVNDGDVIYFGDTKVEVFATPGHTKCSVSYVVNDDVMLCSETTGVISNSGRDCGMLDVDYLASHSLGELIPMVTYMPCYLIGYKIALDSLEHMRQSRAKRAMFLHVGVFSSNPAQDVFDYLYEEMEKTRVSITDIVKRCPDEEARLLEMIRLYHDNIDDMQPERAFRLNAAATLKCIEREFVAVE